MDGSIVLELAVIALLLLVNGFFAGAELAVISASRAVLAQRAEAGDRWSRLALQLAGDPDRLLPTVQVGITLVGTLAGAFGGATIVQVLAAWLGESGVGWVAGFRQELALGLFVLAMTYTSVVIGELVPKRLALRHGVQLARWSAWPLLFLARLASPVVTLLSSTTTVILWCLGLSSKDEPTISRQEIEHAIAMGSAEGVLEPVQTQLATEAIRLGERMVRQIMRPRVEIDAADVNTPGEELLGVLSMAGFSRIPVYEGDLDHILGVAHLKDVLRQHYLGWQLDLRKLIRPALFVPDRMPLDDLLVAFKTRKSQFAIVVDEFGVTKGMVTLEDVVEELVGEIGDPEHHDPEPLIVARDKSSWYVDGTTTVEELLQEIGREHLLEQAPRTVSTVAGLVLEQLGRMPAIGESTVFEDLTLEVVDMDRARIDRVLVRVSDDAQTREK